LRHNTPKPGYSCIRGVRNYFGSLPNPVKDEELVVIGDRIFTDVVMANRMKSGDNGGRGPLAIWTSGVWKKEAMGTRWIEKKLVEAVTKHTNGENQYTTQFLKPRALEKSWDEGLAPQAYSSNAGRFEGIWKHFVRRSS
jgi:phosphatidylglycerophosphatase GEP4